MQSQNGLFFHVRAEVRVSLGLGYAPMPHQLFDRLERFSPDREPTAKGMPEGMEHYLVAVIVYVVIQ